jgi:hypothetical protein
MDIHKYMCVCVCVCVCVYAHTYIHTYTYGVQGKRLPLARTAALRSRTAARLEFAPPQAEFATAEPADVTCPDTLERILWHSRTEFAPPTGAADP